MGGQLNKLVIRVCIRIGTCVRICTGCGVSIGACACIGGATSSVCVGAGWAAGDGC